MSSTIGRWATGSARSLRAGLVLLDVVEPEWPSWNDQVWGGWSPQRGALIPGTAIFVSQRPGGKTA